MALVLLLGWEGMFVRVESGFWWGFRFLVDEEKAKHWERKVNEGKVFLCFFKCCIIFQVLLLSTMPLYVTVLLSSHLQIGISSRYQSRFAVQVSQIVVASKIQWLHQNTLALHRLSSIHFSFTHQDAV
jgi:hypothetical protein